MLKEYNKKQDSIINNMKNMNKNANKNKREMRIAMGKLQEKKILREKFIEEKKNELLQKQFEVQEMKQKTIRMMKKKQDVITSTQEKAQHMADLTNKIEEAKEELIEVLDITREKKRVLSERKQKLDQITADKEKEEREAENIEVQLTKFDDRKLHTYFYYKRFLHNRVQELKGNVRVFCRVRPTLESVDDKNDMVFTKGLGEYMRFPDQECIEVNIEPDDLPTARKKNSKNAMTSQMFKFDSVFNEHTTQEDIFKEVSELVVSAIDGYKVCIFAYGQTGSGKTYTMEGNYENPDEKGIIPRSVEVIFEHINSYKENGWEFKLKVNFQEIYREQIRDLLAPSKSMKHINKSSKYEPTVVEVTQADQVYTLMNKARENRVVCETECNEHSSRSHSLFQLTIEGSNPNINDGVTIDGALNLIDLAGSERLHKSKVQGDRMKEAMSINKSLS